MNYRHGFHAGNFADIAKHVALVACLEALKRKPTPFFALDTHAGRGEYDLEGPEARKSGEAERGIQRLLEAAPAAAGSLEAYWQALDARPGRRLARYRGSGSLIAQALRTQDRAVLIELDPATARAAQRTLRSAGRLRVEIGDGYAALRANLPPRERRGLVLIDPPFERTDELEALLSALSGAWKRWPTGIYLAWYPIRSAAQRAQVHRRLRALVIPKMLSADLTIHRDDTGIGLAGSGLAVINPPFGLEPHLRSAYETLHDVLASPGVGYAEVARLTPEKLEYQPGRSEHGL